MKQLKQFVFLLELFTTTSITWPQLLDIWDKELPKHRKHRENTLVEMPSDEGERTRANVSKHQLQTLPNIQNQLHLCGGHINL